MSCFSISCGRSQLGCHRAARNPLQRDRFPSVAASCISSQNGSSLGVQRCKRKTQCRTITRASGEVKEADRKSEETGNGVRETGDNGLPILAAAPGLSDAPESQNGGGDDGSKPPEEPEEEKSLISMDDVVTVVAALAVSYAIRM